MYKVNKIFEDLDSVKGTIFLSGGYGSGKTTYAINRLLDECMRSTDFECVYYKENNIHVLKQDIIHWIEKRGLQGFTYSKYPNGDNEIKYFGKIVFSTVGNTCRPNCILVEDVNQISFEAFAMLNTRLRQGINLSFATYNNCDTPKSHWINDIGSFVIKYGLNDFLNVVINHKSMFLDNEFLPLDYYNKLIIKAGGDRQILKSYILDISL
jgi:phage terminase large subunit